MKIRLGHVSNSSASSFTIYGWTEKELSQHIGNIMPSFFDVDMFIDDETFCDNLEKLWDGHEWDIVADASSDGMKIFGLGEAGDEIDHNVTEGRWEDFKYPEPSDEKKKAFDEVAKKLNLPKPSIYQETFFD